MLTLGPKAFAAGYRVMAFDAIGSTNAEALACARAGETGPAWFATTEQTAGRGRRQRSWIAPRGNLAASVLESLSVSPAVAATLGFAAGLALEAALRALCGDVEDFRLKWPNDVLGGSSKLAGILLEAETLSDGRLAVVVGIGVNVIAAPDGTPYPATSLRALGFDATADTLFAALTDAWAEQRTRWDDGRGFAKIRRDWLLRAAGLGEPVSVRTGATAIDGVFETIDETGSLIVRTAGGRLVPISGGDVFFGEAASAGAA